MPCAAWLWSDCMQYPASTSMARGVGLAPDSIPGKSRNSGGGGWLGGGKDTYIIP